MKKIMKNMKLVISLVLFVLIGPNQAMALQTSEESKALMDDLLTNIKQTLLAVAKAEQEAGSNIEDLYIEIAIPASLSPNLGLVLEPNDNKGLKVLSISPGSFAEHLKIQQGDHIVSINEVGLKMEGGREVLNELQDITPGDSITLGLERKGERLEITSVVNGEYLPAFRLEVGQAELSKELDGSSLSNELELSEDACGTVSVLFRPPETKRLYSLIITHINDRKVLSSKAKYRLAPGKYTLRVQEQIDDPLLKRRRVVSQRPKLLEVEVKANQTYYLAAKFITEKRLRPQTNEFWEPVVWKVKEDSACKL
ncbi:PDZ domain-containing protein [Brumicola blandensis]|uniref:PDZ domain-containing protein n=1 Tax=Brumicola blandensis TaxID=3075611 RepID=A0AAW8QV39_9ALTE|nr:PDZ domain-containing protein [Alteromonas sp. W409]MDT0580961.1 PDZ domain-containing protein [Alteromonas sp. W409]